MEKFLSVFAPTFAAGLILFMLVSAHLALNNYYSIACARARAKSILWTVAGDALFAGACYQFYQCTLGIPAGAVGPVIMIGVLLALSFCTFGGFNFTIEE